MLAYSKLFCVISELGIPIEEKVQSLDTFCLAMVNLDSQNCTIWAGNLDNLIVSELLGYDDEDSLMYATVGFRKPGFRGPVEYFLASFHWPSGTTRQIEPMTDIFF
jgi:hypothetical protein